LTGLERVRAAVALLDLDVRIVSPGVPMPTVPLAAAAIGSSVDQIVKTVVFAGVDQRVVIAIANGTHRIDRGLLADVAGFDSLKLAPPELVFELNGYPAGGVYPIGIRESEAPIVIDPAVLDEEIVYGGAGTEDDLIEIKSADLLRVTQATVRQITRRE
jgi:prolyl-tRNA editing enzyme YbaK/EbsC (Cys-tRNA(Pro) deacylase)